MGVPAPEQGEQGKQGQQGDVLTHLDAFLAAQRERAEQYHMLDTAHRAYLASGAEGPYRFTMQVCVCVFVFWGG